MYKGVSSNYKSRKIDRKLPNCEWAESVRRAGALIAAALSPSSPGRDLDGDKMPSQGFL